MTYHIDQHTTTRNRHALEQVRHALQDLPHGQTIASVARDAGLSWPTVRDIAEGRTADPRHHVLACLGASLGLGRLVWQRPD